MGIEGMGRSGGVGGSWGCACAGDGAKTDSMTGKTRTIAAAALALRKRLRREMSRVCGALTTSVKRSTLANFSSANQTNSSSAGEPSSVCRQEAIS
jgi:hypothetical protein